MARWLRLLVGSQLLALALIAITHLVPNEAILDRLEADRDVGSISSSNTPVLRTGGTSDRFGECVLATVGVRQGGWLGAVASSPNLGNCERLDAQLAVHAAGDDVVAVDKVRYWNGLSVVARPVLWVAGINVLRLAGALVLVASLVFLAREASGLGGRTAGVALVAPTVLTADLVGLVDVFHHPMMLAAGLATIGWLLRAAGDGTVTALAERAAVAGAAYSFVDLLNFLPGIWLTSAVVVFVGRPAATARRDRARAAGAVTVAWIGGYSVMWVMAWVWAALATSPSTVWDSVTGQLSERINGESVYATGAFAEGAKATLNHWLDRPGASIVIPLLVLAGLVGLAGLRRDRAALTGVAMAIAPLFLSVPWFLATNNHHEIHHWFEYRSLPLMAGAALFVVAVARAERHITSDAR